MSTVKISVIVSTYDSPAWLEKVLWGYRIQDCTPAEIIVADDGSGPETALVIERHRRVSRVPVVHAWQPHEGFRKCRILNQAIAAAAGDYLIFSDGDCIPRRDFVATHVRLARRRCGLSGGCIRLPLAASRAITEADIFSGRCMEESWIRVNGGFSWRGLLKVRASASGVGGVVDHLTPTRPSFNGHNASVWRDDALGVNGFDERMEYGGLDREFGERLTNRGVRFLHVRHRAVCLHLHHERPYVSPESWARNDAIRAETRRLRATWTSCGIAQPAAAAGTRVQSAA